MIDVRKRKERLGNRTIQAGGRLLSSSENLLTDEQMNVELGVLKLCNKYSFFIID